MFVKICGVTTVADAVDAVEAGADAIGLNFWPASRRFVDHGVATEIVTAVGDRVLTVGVFRDHLEREVLDAVAVTGVRAVQLHGGESVAMSTRIHAHVPVLIRALSVGSPMLGDVEAHGADVVLLDAPVPGGGEVFDWHLVGDLTSRTRVLLAGGLRPDNVADAVAQVRPWGVDVASGVESGPGAKDPSAVRRFVTAARDAAAQHPPLDPKPDLDSWTPA